MADLYIPFLNVNLLILPLFFIGLVFGSFLNVVIDRLPNSKLFSNARSYCESCHSTLNWYDLFPLLSYFLLKGKCRYCKSSIPYRLPLVEFLTGLGFISVYMLTPSSLLAYLPFYLILFCFFVSIFFIDAINQIIPDILLAIMTIVLIVLHIFMDNDLIQYLISAIGSSVFFFMLFVITKGRGMGFGDVKFAFVIGLLLGYPASIVAFYAAFLIGALISIVLIIFKKKKLKGSKIAFGPFMILGVIVALLFTELLLNLFF